MLRKGSSVFCPLLNFLIYTEIFPRLPLCSDFVFKKKWKVRGKSSSIVTTLKSDDKVLRRMIRSHVSFCFFAMHGSSG